MLQSEVTGSAGYGSGSKQGRAEAGIRQAVDVMAEVSANRDGGVYEACKNARIR